MVLQVCQDLSSCLNSGSRLVVQNQKHLLGHRYLIIGNGFDYAYIPLNIVLNIGLLIDALSSKKLDDGTQPLISRSVTKISSVIDKTACAVFNVLFQIMFGFMQVAFISLDREAPSSLNTVANNLSNTLNRYNNMTSCNSLYSTPAEGRANYIINMDGDIKGFASSFNYFVTSAIKDSAGFKMALSCAAIIGLALVSFTGERTFKTRPLTAVLVTFTLLFNLATIGISIYQFSTLPKAKAGDDLILAWNVCKTVTTLLSSLDSLTFKASLKAF